MGAGQQSILDEVRNEMKENSASSNQNKIGTEKIEISDRVEQHQPNAEINFLDNESINGFAKEKTKEASPKSEGKTKTIDELRSDIKREEDQAYQFTAEELHDFAEIIVGMIDFGVASGLRWWSGDNTDSPYQLSVVKRNLLIKQMTMILVKHQIKFKIEFLFIISLVVVYASQFRKAHKMRKERKATAAIQIQEESNPSRRVAKKIKRNDKQEEEAEEVEAEIIEAEVVADEGVDLMKGTTRTGAFGKRRPGKANK